jgi:Antitoxin FitA-like, ribbon-helix-helix
MASITIRNLDEQTKERLKVRAAAGARWRHAASCVRPSPKRRSRHVISPKLSSGAFSRLPAWNYGALARLDAGTVQARQMILLDTDVLSEMMRPSPAANVVRWIASQPGLSSFILHPSAFILDLD